MKKFVLKSLIAASVAMLGGCAASIPPVEVTRFHLGQAMMPGKVSVAPVGAATPSLEYQNYANAVAGELQRLGYGSGTITDADYIATLGIIRDTRQALAQKSPFSIGIGGGTGGYRGGGVGVGVGFSFGGKPRDTIVTQLSVQIKRRVGGEVVWEGRAQTISKDNSPAAQPGIAAGKLASALFKDFPGESGRTITVP